MDDALPGDARAPAAETLAPVAGAPVVVVHEDAYLLAVAKPAGLVTHPAYKHPDGTLCDFVFARQAARGEARPWLLHRLDRDTSGLVLFAKTAEARRALVRQFERRTVSKQYLAVLAGPLDPPTGEIDAPLLRDPLDRRRTIVASEGQAARTRYRVLGGDGGIVLALAEPLTGRTHQIRAHFAARGAPLVGDARYLPPGHPAAVLAGRALLHAWRLAFRHLVGGARVCLCVPPPPDISAFICALRLENTLSTLPIPLEEAACS